MSSDLGGLLASAGALCVVLGLIWGAQSLARRSGGWFRATAAGPARLALVQSLAIDTRRRVQLVRCDGRHFLLLTGGTQDVMLGYLPGEGRP